jgi:hypothetical protein
VVIVNEKLYGTSLAGVMIEYDSANDVSTSLGVNAVPYEWGDNLYRFEYTLSGSTVTYHIYKYNGSTWDEVFTSAEIDRTGYDVPTQLVGASNPTELILTAAIPLTPQCYDAAYNNYSATGPVFAENGVWVDNNCYKLVSKKWYTGHFHKPTLYTLATKVEVGYPIVSSLNLYKWGGYDFIFQVEYALQDFFTDTLRHWKKYSDAWQYASEYGIWYDNPDADVTPCYSTNFPYSCGYVATYGASSNKLDIYFLQDGEWVLDGTIYETTNLTRVGFEVDGVYRLSTGKVMVLYHWSDGYGTYYGWSTRPTAILWDFDEDESDFGALEYGFNKIEKEDRIYI